MPYKDPEIRKQKAKEYSRRHYLKTKAETILRTKEWKAKNRERSIEHSRNHRRRKDPTIKIGDIIRDFSRGNICHTEYLRRMQRTIDDINAQLRSK